MKKYIFYVMGLFLVLTMFSCNTYRWQRKRYYQKDPSKNWNHYKKTNKSKGNTNNS
ncbi:MAG: hypothetical protein IPN26_04160 [Bacteroidetes bacterium]|jgi:hypothetical protein|nr:hypothetical protein [Bacteroidota bacterium]